MKYCSNCGKELDDVAVVCPNCGAQVGEIETKSVETGTLGILAIVFSLFGGWIGLLLSIIGLCTYKLPANKTKCKIALGISLLWILLWVVLFVTVTANIASYAVNY